MKKLRKGFTIVELVIVIAVIAVLTAILIPTFVHLSKKAKVSSDQSLVANLNTALKMEEGEKGRKPTTMHEAVAGLKNQGYYTAQFVTKSGYDLVYSIEDNKFYLSNDSYLDEKNKYDFWHIQNKVEPNQQWSIYAFNWNTESQDVQNLQVGFDAGEEFISSIEFNRSEAETSRTVLIRTNSDKTSLSVNAPKDIINHYDEIGSLNIIAAAKASYHEFGSVTFAEIATGRMVLESSSNVERIHFTATGEGSEAFFDDITVAKANDVEMPKFSRDSVEIPEEGKLVVALQDGTDKDDDKDYVWLTAVGIYEQVTVSDSNTEPGNNYAANSEDEEKKEAAQQIANNITFSDGDEEYKVAAKTTDGGATWTYEVQSESGEVSAAYTAALVEETGEVVVKDSSEQIVETITENGLDQTSKEEAEKAAVGYIARVGSEYYTDAEVAFKEANPSTDTVVFLNETKINVSNIPNEINFELNGVTVHRTEIGEKYVQLGHLPWHVWDYDLGGYIKGSAKNDTWYQVTGSTFPLWRNGAWEYPTDKEIFDLAREECPEYTDVTLVDMDDVPANFKGNSTALKYFAGGYGTSEEPFVISNSKEFGNVNLLGLNRRAYYLLTNNISTNAYVSDHNVDFNLNGHTITKTSGNALFWAYDYMNVYNGSVVLIGDNSSVFGDNSSSCEIHASNLILSGTVNVTSYHYGALIKYLGNSSNNDNLTSKMYVENIISYVDIKANSTSVGGLFGYCLNASLDLRNVAVYSSIETALTAGGIVMGDSQVCGYSNVEAHQYMTVSNVKFYGNILVPEGKNAYYYGQTLPNKSADSQDNYKGEGATIVKGINIDNQLIVAEDNEFVINADSQYTKYVVKYQFAVDYVDDRAGGYPRAITKEFEITSSEQVRTGIYKYSLVEREKEEGDQLVSDEFNRIFTHDGLENTYCYDGQDSFKLSSKKVSVFIYAYTGNNLKAIGSYSYIAE